MESERRYKAFQMNNPPGKKTEIPPPDKTPEVMPVADPDDPQIDEDPPAVQPIPEEQPEIETPEEFPDPGDAPFLSLRTNTQGLTFTDRDGVQATPSFMLPF